MSVLSPVDAQFGALRHSMVGQVASHASLVADRTGREILDEAVMAALGRVPRHEFVPVEMKLFAYLVHRCRLATARPSRNHLSSG